MSKRSPKNRGALVRREPAPIAYTPEQLAANPMLVFERLARDRAVDPAKLERLIAMQERILAVNAKAAFDEAFANLQLEIPELDKRGVITNKEGNPQSRYSKNEDVQKVLKPILHRHGFALSFRTEWPQPGLVKVVGILTHRQGHARESEFQSSADQTGGKNAVQALGSTVAYGHRYTTKDLLNLTSRDEDTDGATSAPARRGKSHIQVGYPQDAINQQRARRDQEARREQQQRTEAPAAGRDNSGDQPISDFKTKDDNGREKVGQVQRLWTIIRRSGRTQEEVKAWLGVAYNIDSTKKIKRRDYDAICKAVEAPGVLPRPASREPGEEG